MSVTQTLTLAEMWVDTEANSSNVRIVWKSTQSGESYNGFKRTAKYYVSKNGGAETAYSVSYTLPQNSTTTIVDTIITVPHLNDGTGSVRVRTWMDTSISAGVVEKSETLTLTTIPRAATIDALYCTTNYFTGAFSHSFTSKNPNLYNRCDVSLNLDGKFIHIKSILHGKGYNGTYHASGSIPKFGENELSTVYNNLPNADKGTLRFTMLTYSDSGYSNQVGEEDYKEITLYIPNTADTQPTVSMSLSPSSTLESPYNSLYIQGMSKVKATLAPQTKYGATIVASSITVNGKTYADPYESDILAQDEKVTVKATVKDSRGFYGTYYQDIEVIPYSKPYVRSKSGESSIIAARCDASASFTNDDTSLLTYLKIKAKIVYSDVLQKNHGYIKYRYRVEGGSYPADWTTILDCKAQNSDEVITAPLLDGKLKAEYNYQVQIIAADDFYESEPFTAVLPSDKVYMHRPVGGKGMGLGGYSSGDDRLDVYWKTMARGGLSLVDSTGVETPIEPASVLSIGEQLPSGWNPDNLANGVYAVAGSKPLQVGSNVIMRNGVLIQMSAYGNGDVKIQLALTSDEDRNPYYRVYWYGGWGNWRSFKL